MSSGDYEDGGEEVDMLLQEGRMIVYDSKEDLNDGNLEKRMKTGDFCQMCRFIVRAKNIE